MNKSKWHSENKDRVKSYMRAYYQKNKKNWRRYNRGRTRWRRENPERWKEIRIKHLYGLSPEQYERLKKRAGGRCQVCGEKKKLDIDHDHKTGVVRGLLCRTCNTGIGLLKESPRVLEKARIYLSNGAS